MPRTAQPLERGDGVGHPAAERVDRVDEQQGVVGVHVGVGLEGGALSFAEGDEQLDHRVGVRSGRREPEGVGDGAFDVDAAPPTIDARDAASAPSAAARRMPNSSTGRPCAASTIRAALVAMSVEKLSWLSNGVSSSWAGASGPSTTVIGVFGWTTRPSGTASMRSPPKSTSANHSQKASSKSRPPSRDRWPRSASTSAGVALVVLTHSANGPIPAATQYPAW